MVRQQNVRSSIAQKRSFSARKIEVKKLGKELPIAIKTVFFSKLNKTVNFRSIVHGDLWHNNIFFAPDDDDDGNDDVITKADPISTHPLLIADWQMCHVGNAANDLCFLVFSSTTPSENYVL